MDVPLVVGDLVGVGVGFAVGVFVPAADGDALGAAVTLNLVPLLYRHHPPGPVPGSSVG